VVKRIVILVFGLVFIGFGAEIKEVHFGENTIVKPHGEG
jgi:hypothetical protein